MANIGMIPDSVFDASSSLEKAAGEVSHASRAAATALGKTVGLPPHWIAKAYGLQARAFGAATSGDAFVINSVDLDIRARKMVEADSHTLMGMPMPLNPISPGLAAAEAMPILWNPATRDMSRHNPGKYFDEVDAMLHPDGPAPPKPKTGLHGDAEASAGGSTSTTATLISGSKETPDGEGKDDGKGGKDPHGKGGKGKAEEPEDLTPQQLAVEAEIHAALEAGETLTIALPAGVTVEGSVGGSVEVKASAGGHVSINGVDVSLEAGATVQVKASGSVTEGPVSANGSASLDAGAKAALDGSARMDHGHLKIHLKIALVVGIGGSLDGSVDIDLGAIFGDDKPTPVVGAHPRGPNGPAVIDNLTPKH